MSVAGLAAHLAEIAKASSPIRSTIIQTTTTKALQFAAGKSAAEVGVSTAVATAAQGVITAMTVTKFSMIGAAALAIVLGATAIDGVNGVLSSLARAETIFFDDFDDGNAMDGNPANWTAVPDYSDGTLDASSGDYVLRPSSSNSVWIAAGIFSPPLVLGDVSIRAQIRAETQNEGIGLLARGTIGSTGRAYQGGIFGDGVLYIFQNGPLPNEVGRELVRTSSEFRPINEDVVLQFDVIGETLSLYAWRPGESRPPVPQLQTRSSLFDEGAVGVSYDPGAPGRGSATFRYIHVADASIPEPPTAMLSAVFFAGVFAWQWRRWR
jgi:hypothetical protein